MKGMVVSNDGNGSGDTTTGEWWLTLADSDYIK